MNKETLNKLKELAQAATPGPWRLHHQPGEKYTPTLTDAGHYDEDYFAVAAGIDGDGETVVICDNGQYYSVKVREYDCRFIAAANPVAVLELIALADLGLQAEEGRPEPESEENHQKRMAILTAERDRLIAAERTTSPVSQMTDEQQRQVEKCLRDGAIMGSVSDSTVDVVRAILAAAAPHAQAVEPQPVAEQGELLPLPVDLDYLIEYIAQPAVREALRNHISAYARAAIAASQQEAEPVAYFYRREPNGAWRETTPEHIEHLKQYPGFEYGVLHAAPAPPKADESGLPG